MNATLIPLVATILSLLIPIVAIVFGTWASVRKKQNEATLRRMIVENKTDPETAKILLAEYENKKSSEKYSSLRGACVLIGLGLGAFADYCLNIDGIYFWLIIAFGIGIGLLASFFIEMNLRKQNPPQES